jgi:hypothetical protein
MSVPGQVDVLAQTKPPTCDPKVEKCDGGTPCSPGYWKNHPDEFATTCAAVDAVSDVWDCTNLYAAVTCKGSDATCKRSAAAAALNSINGCTE